MIAAIYARKSTEQSGVADDQKSVARQIEHARQYAVSKGWMVDDSHIYVDDGISGAEFSNRPGFLRLMNALKPRPPFQILVMSELSRLGREQFATAYALGELTQAGVAIHCYLEGGERQLTSPTDKLLLSVATFADEIEREKARQRVTDAMLRKAKAGHVTGGRVFGYDNEEIRNATGERSHVTRRINEAEAAVVRQIFELCARGFGKIAIAKALNAEAALTPRAQQGRPQAWSPSSVRAILYRELYRGEIVWNQSQKRNPWGQHKQRARPESEWVRVPAPALRIISDAQWSAAHARLDATRRTYLREQNGRVWGRPASGVASKYLLVGIARCSICGAGLEVRSRKHGTTGRVFVYSCSSYCRRGPHVCPNLFQIRMDKADGAVVTALLEDLLTPDRLDIVLQRASARASAWRADDLTSVTQLETRFRETEARLHHLTAAVAAGGDVPSLVAAIKTQEAERQSLTRRLETVRRPPVVVNDLVRAKLHRAVDQWRTVLGRQPMLARQIVTKLLEGRITFAPETQDGRPGFRFRATGTVEKLVLGSVPQSFVQAVASPEGFEPSLPA